MFIYVINGRPFRVVRRRPPLPEISKEQAKELRAYLTTEVERWRVIMGEEPVVWTIRNMRSQWGNCRPQLRKLTFNLQLARVENDLRDYIIVHELSHLKVPNHGAAFKAREAEFMPDFRQRQRRLKAFCEQINASTH